MTSSRVIICHLVGRMGKLEKVADTNISHIKASPSASLDDDDLTSEISKHQRKKGGYIRLSDSDYILSLFNEGENVSVIVNEKSKKMTELVKYFCPEPKSRQAAINYFDDY